MRVNVKNNSQRTAEREQKVRNENMVEQTRIGWRGVRYRKNGIHKKA